MVPCSCQNAHLHAAAKDRFCFRWIVWLHAAGCSFIFNTPERLDWKAPLSFIFLYIIMFIIITFPTFLQHHLLLIPLQHCAETVSYIRGSLFFIIIIPVQANHDTEQITAGFLKNMKSRNTSGSQETVWSCSGFLEDRNETWGVFIVQYFKNESASDAVYFFLNLFSHLILLFSVWTS